MEGTRYCPSAGGWISHLQPLKFDSIRITSALLRRGAREFRGGWLIQDLLIPVPTVRHERYLTTGRGGGVLDAADRLCRGRSDRSP